MIILDLHAYTRPIATSPPADTMDPRQMFADQHLGMSSLYEQGLLMVPSNSAFSRPVSQSEWEAYHSTTLPPEGLSLPEATPVAGMDATHLYTWMRDVLSEETPTPRARARGSTATHRVSSRAGDCYICGSRWPNLPGHLGVTGPHRGLWARAILNGEPLTLKDWRCLVLYCGIRMLSDGAYVTTEERQMFKELVLQNDFYAYEESADTPRYTLPKQNQYMPILEFVHPFYNRLVYLARETSDALQRQQDF